MQQNTKNEIARHKSKRFQIGFKKHEDYFKSLMAYDVCCCYISLKNRKKNHIFLNLRYVFNEKRGI